MEPHGRKPIRPTLDVGAAMGCPWLAGPLYPPAVPCFAGAAAICGLSCLILIQF